MSTLENGIKAKKYVGHYNKKSRHDCTNLLKKEWPLGVQLWWKIQMYMSLQSYPTWRPLQFFPVAVVIVSVINNTNNIERAHPFFHVQRANVDIHCDLPSTIKCYIPIPQNDIVIVIVVDGVANKSENYGGIEKKRDIIIEAFRCILSILLFARGWRRKIVAWV